MEIAEDRVHIFLGFPSRYTIFQVVQRFMGRSERKIFQVFPDLKKELVGKRILGRWLICSDSGRESNKRSYQKTNRVP